MSDQVTSAEEGAKESNLRVPRRVIRFAWAVAAVWLGVTHGWLWKGGERGAWLAAYVVAMICCLKATDEEGKE